MEITPPLPPDDHFPINNLENTSGLSVNQMLDKTSMALAGLSKCAALVMAPTEDLSINHIEFVPVQSQKILVILVFSNGQIENRMISLPSGLPAHIITQATNYMNNHYQKKSLSEMLAAVKEDMRTCQAELDRLASDLIARGIASWSDETKKAAAPLILHGQNRLLDDVKVAEDLARVRDLFDKLEMRGHASQLMDSVMKEDGLQIFIGSEHPLFSETGCSVVLSPYRDGNHKIIGAVGVIGPRHMNYAKLIPMVDYTSKMIAKILS